KSRQQQKAPRVTLESRNDLIRISAAHDPASAVEDSDDDQRQPDVEASKSFENKSSVSDVYDTEEGNTARNPDSSSGIQGEAGQSTEPAESAHFTQIGRESSAAPSAESENEREALSVTNDV